jgi:integrase
MFRKYRKKSGIEDMTFHDSRHEAITRLAKKLHVLDLARMTGHKDIKKLMIYYNESAEDIAGKL